MLKAASGPPSGTPPPPRARSADRRLDSMRTPRCCSFGRATPFRAPRSAPSLPQASGGASPFRPRAALYLATWPLFDEHNAMRPADRDASPDVDRPPARLGLPAGASPAEREHHAALVFARLARGHVPVVVSRPGRPAYRFAPFERASARPRQPLRRRLACGRPRGRRAAASSTTAGADPPEPEPGHPSPSSARRRPDEAGGHRRPSDRVPVTTPADRRAARLGTRGMPVPQQQGSTQQIEAGR